jgi:hypothetical protein
MAAILTKYPDVTGVLTDLPAVVAEAKAFIETQGLGGRCEVAATDLLESVPKGGDIYVMKSVLHGLNDEQAVAVLKNCRGAMTASASLLVIEAVLPPHGSPSPSTCSMFIGWSSPGARSGARKISVYCWKQRASICIVPSRLGHKTISSKPYRSSRGAS